MSNKRRFPKNDIKIGFSQDTVQLEIAQIIPLKLLTTHTKATDKYKQILASIKEVGIIEPPVVTHSTQGRNRYMLLDGHMRLEALRELGETEVICIVAEDDESFTYNKHVNRLSAIQEHKMILLAVERGVPEEKIAKALNLDVTSIVRRRNLLEGIAPEVAELLKDKLASVGIFPVLRKMKPVRQVEAAMLMCDSANYSLSYARAMLAATPKDQLVNPDKPKSIKGLTDEQIARMETEMASLQREYRLIEENYGTDVLNLTLAKGYITSLLSNARIVRYLAQHHSQMLGEFQKVAEMKALVTER
jgi:hypothetical protein